MWGAAAGCRHEWGEAITEHKRGKVGDNSTLDGGAQPRIEKAEQGAFCRLCGAWRGTLGLEPTPELYCEHMVEVFREVRRVLRGDGTVWLNLGSSFISKRAESEELVLREDLTPEERAYVFTELAKHERESAPLS